MAKFFIDRPVFAIVLSLLVVIGGTVAIFSLPIARFPEITPPQINITAVYPGADANALAESVAAPIEQQLSGIKHLIYFQSQNDNDGTCKITCTFDIGTDQDLASVEVQNRVSIAEPQLPEAVRQQGVTITKASSSILGIVAVESKEGTYDDLYLSNYATINLLDRIKRVPGVGDATVYGNKNYSMRVWLNPDTLALKGLTISDVTGALRDQNAIFPAGTISQRPTGQKVELTLPVLTKGRLAEVADYENIILKATNEGALVRLKDVARIELGAQGYSLFGRLNGKPTALLIVNLQAGANALDTMKNVRVVMDEGAKTFPAGVTWSVPYDTTPFVTASIENVVHTLLEAVLLVVVVVFVFLQSWRATLIPLLAVPVAIIGTFGVMLLLGFSINTLTLFGMVLAIGIVVDDAIVVVENVERIMHDEKLNPYDATVKAMEEVTGPIIAIVLVLSAVFLPVAFLGGFTGQMYKQFAITIAVSVTISGGCALSLSPALAAMLLKPPSGKQNFLARGFNNAFGKLTEGYGHAVKYTLHAIVLTLVVFGLLCFTTYKLNGAIPSGFLPDEDQGSAFAIAILPDGGSLDKTQSVVEKAEKIMMKHPAVESVVGLGGYDILTNGTTANNSGALFVSFKPFEDRKDPALSAAAVVRDTNEQLMGAVNEGLFIVINPPAIQGLGSRSGFTMEVQQKGGGTTNELAAAGDKFLNAMRADPRLAELNSTLRVAQPQVFLTVNREKAQMLGVKLVDIFEPLQAYFGTDYVNDFNQFGRVWRVQVQADAEFRRSPQDIEKVFVRNTKGEMVPLTAVVDMKFRSGPNLVSRFNGFPAIEITGAPGVGQSTGQAYDVIRDIAAKELTAGYEIDWAGASYQEIKAGNQAPQVLAFGLVVVFLVLAAQYERWLLPFAVLGAVPLGLFGAYLFTWVRDYQKDIYFQVGLLTLIGLAAKNAVLIVEFCVALRAKGEPIDTAAVDAAKLRFRPILMTSLAFILGVVPLALASGAGAAGRRSIGTAVVGGMIAATFLAVFFVPLFYVLVQRATEFRSERWGARVAAKNTGSAESSPAH